ncbi:MAG: response regulator transcription factor [Granulosicoccaceae bacterium]
MKILIADDHELIRQGLERTLVAMSDDVDVVHAEDGLSVLEQLEQHRDVDIVLLDLFMPNANGYELLRNICDRYGSLPVIVVSAAEEPQYMRKSIDYGAAGFIPKSSSTDIMVNAIKLVMSGGIYIPHTMHLQSRNVRRPVSRNTPDYQLSLQASDKLTRRQKEVLELLARGSSNKDIARTLGLSEHTVKIHVTAILKLLNATNRTEAVIIAQRLGVIDGDSIH